MMGRTDTYQENPLRVNHSSHVSCMYWETPLKLNLQPAHEQKVKKKAKSNWICCQLAQNFSKQNLQFLNIFGECHVMGRWYVYRENPLKVNLHRVCTVRVSENSFKAKLITCTWAKSEKKSKVKMVFLSTGTKIFK